MSEIKFYLCTWFLSWTLFKLVEVKPIKQGKP